MMCIEIPTSNDAKDFYKELILMRIEQDESHNIFTNYSNYTRDEFVAEQAFEKCWELIKELNDQARMFRHQRDDLHKKLFSGPIPTLTGNNQ